MKTTSAIALALLAPAAAFQAAPATRLATKLATATIEPETPEEEVVEAPAPPAPRAWDIQQDMQAGITGPFGFFDPLSLAAGKSEQRLKYFREAELKHARVAMLAAAGFVVAEGFHPLFGGNIDVPSYVAYQQTPLQTFWPVVLLYVGIVEIFSVFTFENPFGKGGFWTLKDDRVRRPRPRLREFGVYLVLTSRMPWPRRGPNVTPSPQPAEQKGTATRNDVVRLVDWLHTWPRAALRPHACVPSQVPGDFSWDPMDMYPTDPAGRIDMQTKELNNGRVAMIAIAGMVAQELATGGKLF